MELQSTLRQRMASVLAVVAIAGSALAVAANADDAEAALKWREDVKPAKTTDKDACDPTVTVCK